MLAVHDGFDGLAQGMVNLQLLPVNAQLTQTKELHNGLTLFLHRSSRSAGREWPDGPEREAPFWAQRGEICSTKCFLYYFYVHARSVAVSSHPNPVNDLQGCLVSRVHEL